MPWHGRTHHGVSLRKSPFLLFPHVLSVTALGGNDNTTALASLLTGKQRIGQFVLS